MKLVRLGRFLDLPEGLREAEMVTVQFFPERRFGLHAGNENAAAHARAKEAEDDSRRTREAIDLILWPMLVKGGTIELSKTLRWHLGNPKRAVLVGGGDRWTLMHPKLWYKRVEDNRSWLPKG